MAITNYKEGDLFVSQQAKAYTDRVAANKADKSDTYTKTEVDEKISEISGMELLPVSELPTENIRTDAIYLVPNESGEANNAFDEYINPTGTAEGYEKFGSATISLDGYVTETSLEETLTDYATTEAVGTISETVSGLKTEVENTTDELRTEVDYAINTGAKNLLPNLAHYYNQAGVDFIENPDGSITANGTATADIDYTFTRRVNKDFVLDAGAYIVSGANRISKNKVFDDESEFEQIEIAADGTFTLTEKSQLQVTIRINNGETVDNVTYYPMIRRADISDGSYVPYAQTNSVLTETKAEKSDVTGLSKTVAKNLLPNNATSKTQNGITFTVNDDGSVTINGTSTADASLPILEAFEQTTLYKGESYILSKGVNDKANVGIFINCYSNRAFKRTIAQISGTNGTETKAFTLDYADYDGIRIAISIGTGVTLENYTVYPMLRYAEIKDDTFVPYSMTARELTTALSTKADAETVIQSYGADGYVGKNLFRTNEVSSRGITVTKRSDGGFVVNGTPTDTSGGFAPDEYKDGYLEIPSLTQGEYIFTLADENGDAPANMEAQVFAKETSDGAWKRISLDSTGKFSITTDYPVMWARVKFDYNVTFTDAVFYPMIRAAYITDGTFEAHLMTNAELAAHVGAVDYAINTGVKNLLDLSDTVTGTWNGLTFSKNDDGSVTINGTATANSTWNLVTDIKLDEGEYILSKNVSNGIYSYLSAFKEGAWVRHIIEVSPTRTYNSGVVDYSDYDMLKVSLYVSGGTEVDNVTIYPMLRDASIVDDTFQKYAMTNTALTEKVDAVEEEVTAIPYLVDTVGKNLLKYEPTRVTDRVHNGITFKCNADNSITLDGTATGGDANFILCQIDFGDKTMTAPQTANGYTLTDGGVEGTSSSTYKVTYDANNKYTYVGVKEGVSVENLTFYPMLRLASIKDDSYVPYAMSNAELSIRKISADDFFTLEDGYSISEAAFYKQGNIVNVHGRIQKTEGVFSNTQTQVFTISDKYAPIQPMVVPVALGNQEWTVSDIGYCYVGSNGNVYVMVTSGKTDNNWIYLDLTYVTA